MTHGDRLLVMDWFQSSEIELNVPLDKHLAIFKLSIYKRSPKMYTDTHTHPFNDPFSGTTQVSWYQKGKTNLDFTEARDSEWQWHQPGHMQVCTSLHTSTQPLSFFTGRMPFLPPNRQRLKCTANQIHSNQENVHKAVLIPLKTNCCM